MEEPKFSWVLYLFEDIIYLSLYLILVANTFILVAPREGPFLNAPKRGKSASWGCRRPHTPGWGYPRPRAFIYYTPSYLNMREYTNIVAVCSHLPYFECGVFRGDAPESLFRGVRGEFRNPPRRGFGYFCRDKSAPHGVTKQNVWQPRQ